MSADGSVVQALHEIQERCGFLPRAELEGLSSRRPGLPLHRLHEVASFFPHFRLEPAQGLEVSVCRDMACHLAGAPRVRKGLEDFAAGFGPGRVVIEGVSCLGQCDQAPVVAVDGHYVQAFPLARCQALVAEAVETPGGLPAHAKGAGNEVPKPTGWRIDPYESREDYGAVRRFAANPDFDALIAVLKIADLRGMGGAGVWAHQKWNDVRHAPGATKYVVCNADESEPTTFKDRELLLRVPHVVLEGVILGGLHVGAERGFIYIRHEYEDQIEAVRAAIARAEAMGVCGANILGTGRSFPVEVFVSPGGYICGEQSALIEAMEGKRAEPRNKPPLLETNGLHDKHTLLSNVETFAWVPAIVMRGGEWYRDQGVNGCQGMRFFSICGDLNRPGVYEVPNGTPLRELIELARGLRGGKRLKAFAPSGPSGGFLPAKLPREMLPKATQTRLPEGATHLDVLDIELDLQRFRDLGLMLGAGMMVYGEGADMLDQALNATEFFRNESCGKCVPCRIGSQKTVELTRRLAQGGFDASSWPDTERLLGELRRAMEMTSICGLGMVAASPVASVLKSFRDDLEVYLNGRARSFEQEDRP
jgi:NADH:ubiquinone oxidoreductase subunit F (NADH-binding)/NADH:ubiquinone oxidoreductase subunit E